MTCAAKTFQGMNLTTAFCDVCREYNISPGQGPSPRFCAQPEERQKEIFKHNFDSDLLALKAAIDDLEFGCFLNNG